MDAELGRARRRARDIRGARAASVVAEATIAQPLGMLSVYAAGARFERHVDNEGESQGCDIPNFKGSSLGRVPLLDSADFWTSDHPSERSRRVDAFSGTRARRRIALFPAQAATRAC